MNSKERLAQVLLAGIILFNAAGAAYAQGSAGSSAKLEPRNLIDIPIAGMIDRGNFAVDIDFYQSGGVLAGFTVGVLDRLSLGVSYGGSKLLGGEPPVMNSLPGVNVKIRLFEEGFLFPALVVGFDSQGKDGYIKSLNRYAIKSPGFYAAVSKNYATLGFLSLHFGVNYSLERADGDRDPNVFAGIEKTIGPVVSLMAEYNLGLNDNDGSAIGRGKGYLNAAMKISVGGGVTIGVNFKDLARNADDLDVANRTVRIEFSKPF